MTAQCGGSDEAIEALADEVIRFVILTDRFGRRQFGAVPLLKYVGTLFPKLRHIFADRVYRGKQLPDALAEFGKWTIEIITRLQSIASFKPERRSWVVERTLAWLNRCRRLSKDFEKTIASAEAWVLLATIRVLSRRLARA